jgi:hypothetical protein
MSVVISGSIYNVTGRVGPLDAIIILDSESTNSTIELTIGTTDTRLILDKGTVIDTTTPVTITDSPQSSEDTTSAVYRQLITSSISFIQPQTRYYIAAYKTTSASTTLSNEILTFTLSNPPISQPTSPTATAFSSTEIDVNWQPGDFPTSGATKKRYVVLRATAPNIPTFTGNNGYAPSAGANTTIVYQDAGSAAVPVTGLTISTEYNFLIIPYCWDGVNPETHNYLIENAPTASATTSTLLGAVISNPTATSITNNTAVLGATKIGRASV